MFSQDSPNAFVPLFASFVHLKVAHGDRIPFCPKVIDCMLFSINSSLDCSAELGSMSKYNIIFLIFLPFFSDQLHLQDKCKSSIFFGNRKTTISIKEYVKRIALHSKCSPICFIGAYVYLQRLNQVSSFACRWSSLTYMHLANKNCQVFVFSSAN